MSRETLSRAPLAARLTALRLACRADFFGETAVARSNNSAPSRLFLDPYHVADGNLWAENFLMGRFQRGGMTSLAGARPGLAPRALCDLLSALDACASISFSLEPCGPPAQTTHAEPSGLSRLRMLTSGLVCRCAAGRSELLRFEKERFGKDDMQSRARSKYLEPEGGRFIPPLKP